MPKTFLSMKKSLPGLWNFRPARKASRSKKNGSLRNPAKNRKPPAPSVMCARVPNDTGARSMTTSWLSPSWPPLPGSRFVRTTVANCLP